MGVIPKNVFQYTAPPKLDLHPPLAQNAPPKMTLHPLASKGGAFVLKLGLVFKE